MYIYDADAMSTRIGIQLCNSQCNTWKSRKFQFKTGMREWSIILLPPFSSPPSPPTFQLHSPDFASHIQTWISMCMCPYTWKDTHTNVRVLVLGLFIFTNPHWHTCAHDKVFAAMHRNTMQRTATHRTKLPHTTAHTNTLKNACAHETIYFGYQNRVRLWRGPSQQRQFYFDYIPS